MFNNKKGFTKMQGSSRYDGQRQPLNSNTPNSSSSSTNNSSSKTTTTTTTTNTTCSLEGTVVGNEFYESGDIILQQGDVIDKILRISSTGGDNQTECILMTRTWSDGTTEEIGRLSAGDHIGLLFYSGFGFMVEDSLVTYTCVKDNVHCEVVVVDLQGGKCVEIMKREMFKVIPGFCLLPYEVLDDVISKSEEIKNVNVKVCKFVSCSGGSGFETDNTSGINHKQIITKGGDSNDCYILLSGIIRPGDFKPSVYRDKEVLEIFGEAKFRNKSATRSGDMFAIGTDTSYLQINVDALKKLLESFNNKDYFKKIQTALRYRGNIMDFQKNNKSMYIDYETLARPFNVDN